MTRVLGRVVEDLKRLTRRGAEGVADMPRGAARFAGHDVDVKVRADQLGGHEVDKAGETLTAPEHRRAATVDPHTVDRGGRPDDTADKRPQETERLSTELLERGECDQEVRRNISHPASKIEIEAMRMVDADNISWFRGVIAKYGWPGTDQVGEDGARAAWLIVQHAPLDLQQQCLPLLRQSVAEGKADRVDLAYLDDRVRTREKRPQVYGTQSFGVGGPIRLLPIETPGRVNDRRVELGLPPLEEEDIANAWTIEEISALPITY